MLEELLGQGADTHLASRERSDKVVCRPPQHPARREGLSVSSRGGREKRGSLQHQLD